ncbi:MAG: flagellar FlbD family protein [Oligoflexales bacterium]|nr:flagellar FlbD family protein [Oligoflexales bacterium]
MIELTKLDQSSILVNLEAIKYVESMPDTLILFLNGDSVIVKESLDEIEEKWLNSKAKVLESLNNSDEL